MFIVNSEFPARSFAEFVEYTKNPGKVRYSSTGIGNFVHCDMEAMQKRLEAFPGVPTYAEVGLAGHGTLNWSALFAATGTPQEIIDTLYKAFTEAVNDPVIQEAAAKSGTFGFAAESPAATAAWLQEELAKWRRTTAEIKIEMN